MTFLSKLLVCVGLASLFHAGYSAHEFYLFQTTHGTRFALPNDITIEVLASLLISTLGIMLSIQPKRALSIADGDTIVTSKHKLDPIKLNEALQLEEQCGSSEFSVLNNRPNYCNILEKRKQFKEWSTSEEK